MAMFLGSLPAVLFAQEAGGSAPIPPERKKYTQPSGEGEKVLELTAGAGSIFGKDELVLKGYVDIHYGDIRLQADIIRYVLATKDCFAEGNVLLDSGATRLTAERVEYNLETQTGSFFVARGYVEPSFYFEAAEVQKVDAERYIILDAQFTTCTQPVPYWSFKVARGTIHLDNYAYLHHVSFRAEKLPVFYSPYLVWPIKKDRATGLLFPEFGYSQTRGFVFTNAFYWAIRRNMDATFFLDYYSKAGLGEGLEYRYVPSAGGRGQFTGAYIHDQVVDEDRYSLNLNHRQELPNDFRLVASLNELSDFEYNLDFQRDYRTATNPLILSFAYLTRNWSNYSFNLRAESREQLYDVSQRVFAPLPGYPAPSEVCGVAISGSSPSLVICEEPFTNLIEPSVEWRGSKQRLGRSPLYFAFETSADNFHKETSQFATTYQRVDIFPTFSAPLRLASWIDVNPTVGLRSTYYSKSLGSLLTEDLNGNAVSDHDEDAGLDGIPGTGDFGEANDALDREDANGNGVLDPGEDLNGNGALDSEDRNLNGLLDQEEDVGLDGVAGTGDLGEGNGVLDSRVEVLDQAFVRKSLQGSVEVIGPQFSRIFLTPNNKFSPAFKHTFEPRVFYLYQSKVDNPEEIIRFDEKDVLSGNVNLLSYSLTTRLFAKRSGTSPRQGVPETGAFSLTHPATPQVPEGQELPAPATNPKVEEPTLSPVEIASFTLSQAYSFLGPLSNRSIPILVNGVPIQGSCVVLDGATQASSGCETSQFSSVDANLRYNPTLFTSLDAKATYDILRNIVRSGNVSAHYRNPDWGFVDFSWFFQKPVDAFSVENQQLTLLTQTALLDHRMLLGFQGHYDLVLRQLQDHRITLGYNTQCCGFTFEYLDRNYVGVSQQEFRLMINLKGIGNVLDLNSGSSPIPGVPAINF
ncbi:MAG: LPS assembly protein LptD [Acidobacteria bacterium]|nr:LPS assembly protein LptD [Acidobacteriota bacterium]